ncbi:MAG: sensor histidine kinase [Flavobacteriia bacterium]
MNESQELTLLIILGMLFAFAMGIGMVVLAHKNRQITALGEQLLHEEIERQNNDKLALTVATQESERGKIARILHDDLGAFLSMAQKNLQLLEASRLEAKQAKALSNASDLIQQSIEEIRTISKDLTPFYLKKFGLAKGLERMGQQKTNTLSDKFVFETNLSENELLDEQIVTHFFYIASELMTNLIKHSQPKTVRMELKMENKALHLLIEHNGIALTQQEFETLQATSSGLGMQNIHYHCTQIEAQLTFKREAKKGLIYLRTKSLKHVVAH